MITIEAPNEYYSNNIKVFLAGGITNCPNWQKEMIKLLEKEEGVTLYNPRRANFPIEDPDAAKTQITWEFNKLKEADIILFWFSRGTLNPIVLYELGMWGNSRVGEKISVIGCDPEYERIQDVEIQSMLAGNKTIHFTLDSCADQIKKEVRKLRK